MKKIIFILLMVLLCGNVFAQGTPVIDITAIIAFLENLYQLQDQYVATLQQLENSYKQMEQTIKNYRMPDFSNLDAKDPLGSWGTIMSEANSQMEYLNKIEYTMNNKNMKLGNFSFSIADMFNPKQQINGVLETGKFLFFDPWQTRTPQEKALFHAKYGMSPGNYLKYNYLGEGIKNFGAKTKAELLEIDARQKRDQEMLETIIVGANNDESQNVKSAAMLGVMGKIAGKLDRQEKIMKELADSFYSRWLQINTTVQDAKFANADQGLYFTDGFVELMETVDDKAAVGIRVKSLEKDQNVQLPNLKE